MATEVSIRNDFFDPDTVTIAIGETVTWRLRQGDHTVTSNPGKKVNCTPTSAEQFDSGLMTGSDTYSRTFNTAGSFAYHCEEHGCSMSGTVKVTGSKDKRS